MEWSKKTCVSFIWLLCLLFIFIFICCFLPVRLNIVSYPSPWYGDIRLDETNTDVEYVSVIGLHRRASNVNFEQTPDGLVTLQAGGVYQTEQLDIIKPDSISASYDGVVYAGMSVDEDKIKVTAVYGDENRDVIDFTVTDAIVPLSVSAEIPVQTMCGIVMMNVAPKCPSYIDASYDDSVCQGDEFDKNKITVTLHYDDGVSHQITDFVVPDAPVYIADHNNMTVITDYGMAVLSVVPSDSCVLNAFYDGVIYEGDEIDKTKVHLMRDQNEIDDIKIDDVGVVKTTTRLNIQSRYGNSVLSISPVRITGCIGKTEDDRVEGNQINISGITLMFDDGTTRDIDISEVIFSQQDMIYNVALTTIWFNYHGLLLSFDLTSVASSVAEIRRTGADILQDYQHYDLTNDDIRFITIIARRIASDNLYTLSDEVSLMANRYEAYAKNQSLVDYIRSSGYWGNDLDNYAALYGSNELCEQVVYDVLCNGHRSLPLSVLERQISDVDVSENIVGMPEGSDNLEDPGTVIIVD